MAAVLQKETATPLGEGKWAAALRRTFFLVYTLAFGWLLLNVVLHNTHFSFSPWLVVPAALAWLAVFWLLYKFCQQNGTWLARHRTAALVAFFVVLAFTQFAVYRLAGGYPTRDFERVFTGAYNYTIAGVIEDPYLDYFYKFPNNMPVTIFWQFVFRAFYKFGVTNFFAVGALVNGCFIAAAYGCTFLVAQALWGTRWGFFALGMLYLCLPLQLYISIFYTDTLTLVFPPLAMYIWLRVRREPRLGRRALWFALLGLAMGFGIQIKYSALLVLVAVAVDMALRCSWRALAALVLSVLAGFMLWNAVFSTFMYNHILDREEAYDKATPLVAWVMMGLRGDGAHNADDNYFVWNFETHQEKESHAWQELKARLSAHTPLSFLQFLNQKGVRSFGSGDLDAPAIVAGSPMHENWVLSFIYPGQPYHQGFQYFVQGYHVAVMALMVAGGALALQKRNYTGFLPSLTMFGLYLFLLLWEAGQRYLLNHMAAMVLAATAGAVLLFCKHENQSREEALALKEIPE